MKKLTIALLLSLAVAFPAIAQRTDDHALLRIVTGKQPKAGDCPSGTMLLWYNGTNWKKSSGASCTSANFEGVALATGGGLATSGAYTGTFTFTATTGVTFPTTGTLATLAGSETFTNKTLTAPIIATISNSGTITVPTGTDTLVGKATTDTLTNKTLTSPVVTTPQINDTSLDHQYVFVASELAADRNVTLPLLTGADTFVFADHIQTVTNKTLSLSNNTVTGTSAEVATAVSDETGSGLLVFATSPALTTPALGAATGTSVTTTGEQTITTANGASWVRGSVSEEITLSTGGTTTDSTADMLPANSIIESAVCRVTTTITTATDWGISDPTTALRFAAVNATMTAGATSVGLKHMQGAITTDAAGPVQISAAKLRITTTGTPGAGAVRCTVFYSQFIAPTS